MDRSRYVRVMEVKDPFDIAIMEVSRAGSYTEFDKLNEDISIALDADDHCYSAPINVAINELYLACIPGFERKWCRVKVDNIMHGLKTYIVCKLIDYGIVKNVSRDCLRKVSKDFFAMRPQVRYVALHGIVPVGMKTDMTTWKTQLMEVEKWSPAAVRSIKNMIENRANITVKYVGSSEHRVYMYSKDNGCEVCVNDELVKEGLAMQKQETRNVKKIMTYQESQIAEQEYLEELKNNDAGVSATSSLHLRDYPVVKPKGRGDALLTALEESEPGANAPPNFKLPSTLSLLQGSLPEVVGELEIKGLIPIKKSRRPNRTKTTRGNLSLGKSELSDSFSDSTLLPADSSDSKTSLSASHSLDCSQEAAVEQDGLTHIATSSHMIGSASSILKQRSYSNTLMDNSLNSSGDEETSVKKEVSFSDTDEIKTSAVEDNFASTYEEDKRKYERRLTLEYDPFSTQHEGQISAISNVEYAIRCLENKITTFCEGPKIRPVRNLENGRIHARALRYWRSQGGDVRSLRDVQTYILPALCRGCEVVAVADTFAISDNKEDTRDGMSITYLMAISTMMFGEDSYKDLPPGNGPRLLVLCASRSKAENVHRYVSGIFGEGAAKSQLVTQGMAKEEALQASLLINGTDVIVSTPYTLVRMLEAELTNMKRLCHLVVDDADVITDQFKKELCRIMVDIGLAVKAHPERAAPRQVALFSTTWTKGIKLFKKDYMTAPVTILGNQIEAAIACNVKQFIQYISTEEARLQKMLELVQRSGTPKLRVVVCVNTKEDSLNVYHALNTLGLYEVVLINEDVVSIEAAQQTWESRTENSIPVLVINDSSLEKLMASNNPIRSADFVLHYNTPKHRKKKFGLRLHCLSAQYCLDENDKLLVSHIIFSPDDYKSATTLANMFERIGGKVPDEVTQISLRNIELNESGRLSELCTFMKAYGYCRNRQCKNRHLISAVLDTPKVGLPTSGDVEFKVTAVPEAGKFFARLIRRRDRAGVLQTIPSKKFFLDLSLAQFFSQPYKKICLEPTLLVTGTFCVYEKDDVYFRAQITRIIDDETAQIRYLDEETVGIAETRKLYKLPEQYSLELFPSEIVEIRLCKLMPMDYDVAWSKAANNCMSQLILGQVLHGRIALSVGNTLWLDPIVKREYIRSSGVWVTLWSTSSKLLGTAATGSLAAKNPKHLDLLRQACAGKISLPDTSAPSYAKLDTEKDELLPVVEDLIDEQFLTLPACKLPEDGDVQVYICAVESPDLIFINLVDTADELDHMEEQLNATMKRKGSTPCIDLSMHTLCTGRDPEDNMWCRCSVISITNDTVQLISVDRGGKFLLNRRDVCMLPNFPAELRTMPFQAIECHLATLLPVDGSWQETATDLLWEKAVASSSAGCLFAKTLSKKPSKYIGDTTYGIILTDTSGPEDVRIDRLLVTAKLAVTKKLDALERLPDLGVDVNTLDYPFQQIPYLCSTYYKTESSSKRLLIIEYIDQLVREGINLVNEMRRHGVIKNLTGLLTSSSVSDDLLAIVIQSLTLLASNSDDNVLEIWWEDGLTFLISQVDCCNNHAVLARVLNIIAVMMKNKTVKNSVDNSPLLSQLIKVVHAFKYAECRQNALDALTVYCAGNSKRSNALLELTIVPVLANLLSSTIAELVCSAAALLNAILEPHKKLALDDDWRNCATQLADSMFKGSTEKVLLECLRALKCLIIRIPDVIVTLQTTGLVHKLLLKRDSGLKAATNELCLSVLCKVQPTEERRSTEPVRTSGSLQKTSGHVFRKPVNKGPPPLIENYVKPTVLWWESRRYLMLHVQIADAETLKPAPVFKYQNGKFNFRCGIYKFSLGPLYAKCIPEKTLQRIAHSEVKYALYKERRDFWSHLVKAGHKKPSFTKVHEDMLMDSSDDDDEDTYPSPFDIKSRVSLGYKAHKSLVSHSIGIPAEEYLSHSEPESSEEEDIRYDCEEKHRFEVLQV